MAIASTAMRKLFGPGGFAMPGILDTRYVEAYF